jgi:hypothetical protein
MLMRTVKRLVNLCVLVALGFVLGGCVVVPYGYGYGHRHYYHDHYYDRYDRDHDRY